ncbi:MAG TPA: CocE/NonD family hydrolase [Caulobacteraceae bacterium]|nr:CocE/NonD family hydrolase [Caulobacteraceae bacterium]
MSIRILAAAAAALCLAAGAAAQPAPKPAAPAQPGLPPIPPPAPHQELFAAMRDGTKLAANVFLPEGKGPFPVVLMRTPYLKDRMAGAQFTQRYTKAGYALVVQDVRGKGHSEGFYAAFTDDIPDGYDTVEWVAAQPWSNGKVGMSGGSALGITANMAAIAAPPHLIAAYVIVAPTDRAENSFMGGVLKEKDTVGWLQGQGVSDKVIDSIRARVISNVEADRGDMSQGLKYIRIPIYNVGGWYDIFDSGNTYNFSYLQNHGANGAKGNQKLLMGPFGHGQLSGDLAYPGADSMRANADEEIRWFDYWLKGIDNGIMDEPPVTYFMMGPARKGAYSPKNRFIQAANWPPASRQVRYYPTTDGRLIAAPPETARPLSYRFDPANPVPTVGGANLNLDRGPMAQRAIGARSDYLRFTTPVLAKDVVIAGAVSVELWAATDGPDTDFMAKLVDVYPDGYEALVLDAPIRARYRNGRMADEVKMMTPGAPERLTIDLWSTAITFEAGHRIMLVITSSNAPRFEVNPNTGEAAGSHRLAPRVATNTVYFDRDHPTALVLPVVYPHDQ